jgi:hypothetical protein
MPRHLWRSALAALAALLALAPQASAAEKPLRFWNLTTVTITELRLAPAGSGRWGPNQCENDRDKSVDPDERLTLTGVAPGRYDVRLTDKHGRVCTVANLDVQAGRPYAFSIADKDLTNCAP